MNAQTVIEPPANVYSKIAAVQGELAKVGIGKNNNNAQQNYRFRGIDDVYNALAPLLAKHRLCVLPRMVSRDREERVTIKEWNGQRKESVLFYVTVEAEFDFVSSDDGSIHTVRTYGEAMDSGDKATNKAMSAAYKYAAFMTFAIPTEGDNDADATTHEVASRGQGHSDERAVSPAPAKQPAHSALKAKVRQFVHELNGCGDGDELSAFLATPDAIKLVNEVREKLPQWWDGWDEQPDGFTPLGDLITRRQRECAEVSAQYLTA